MADDGKFDNARYSAIRVRCRRIERQWVARKVAETERSFVPVWLMGLTNAVFGMYGGILVICVQQLLSARYVPDMLAAQPPRSYSADT